MPSLQMAPSAAPAGPVSGNTVLDTAAVRTVRIIAVCHWRRSPEPCAASRSIWTALRPSVSRLCCRLALWLSGIELSRASVSAFMDALLW